MSNPPLALCGRWVSALATEAMRRSTVGGFEFGSNDRLGLALRKAGAADSKVEIEFARVAEPF